MQKELNMKMKRVIFAALAMIPVGSLTGWAGPSLDSAKRFEVPDSYGPAQFTSGVYHFDKSAQLTKSMSLDFQDNSYGDFIYQRGHARATERRSSADVIRGNLLAGVYWQFDRSGTPDEDPMFTNTIPSPANGGLDPRTQSLFGKSFLLPNVPAWTDHPIFSNYSAKNFGRDGLGRGRFDFGWGRYGFGDGGYDTGDGSYDTGDGSYDPEDGSSTPIVPVPGAFLLGVIGIASVSVFRKKRFLLKQTFNRD